MASSRATENVLAGPPCSTPSPRYSGEKAAVQGDKMGKIAVKAASRMFRVSPPSTSSLRPAPYGGSSIGAPAGAGSVRRTASPGDQLRPQVHGPGHSGLPACPAPSITLRSFHVSPRECRYRLFLGMCHVRRVDGSLGCYQVVPPAILSLTTSPSFSQDDAAVPNHLPSPHPAWTAGYGPGLRGAD